MNLKSALAVAFFLFVIIPCKADTLTVSSQFTFGPSFSDLSLSESGSFSFNWDTATNLILPDTIAYNFTGTLSPFSLLDYGTMTPLSIFHASPFPFMGWRNVTGDTLELALQDLVGNGFPKATGYDTGSGGVIELWTTHHEEEWPIAGTLTVTPAQTPTQVPEPSSGILLLLGLTGTLIVALVFPRPAPRRFS